MSLRSERAAYGANHREDGSSIDPKAEAPQDSTSQEAGHAAPTEAHDNSPIYNELSSPEHIADESAPPKRSHDDAGEASPALTTDGEDEGETGVEWSAWESDRRRLGQESQTEFEGARTKLKRAVAMLAIEIVSRPEHDWDAEAEESGLDVPDSKHARMAATAATFGAQADDDAAKGHRAKFLDRTALAVEYLGDTVRADPAIYPATETGVADLIRFIDREGGITKLASLQRAKNAPASKDMKGTAGAITLNGKAARESHLQKAREYLNACAPNDKAVSRIAIIHDDGENQQVVEVVSATAEEEDRLLLRLNAADRLVDQFGELFQAGEMVWEEKTEILKDQDDDPEGPEKGFRPAFRHFVFADDRPIVISPILTNASVVVSATPRDAIFTEPLGQVCHLRTRERCIAEANIADPERRTAFTAEIREATDTQHGVCRFWLTTQAAAEREDNGRDVGVLVEPLKSAQGNLPLNVDESRFKPKFTGTITAKAWQERHETFIAKHVKAAASSEKMDHTFSASEWKIDANKKDNLSAVAGKGRTSVIVREGDFLLVSKAMAALPIRGLIDVSADPKTGLRFEFRTLRFDYKVFVPSRDPNGGRNAMLFYHYEAADAATAAE